MHEASLAGGVLKLAEDAARREGFSKVERLRLEVGRLAGVELRALRFALQAISPRTVLDGTVFEFDEPEGRAWCLGCCRTVALVRRGDACGHCGGHRLQAVAGTEMRVVDMWVTDN